MLLSDLGEELSTDSNFSFRMYVCVSHLNSTDRDVGCVLNCKAIIKVKVICQNSEEM